MSIAVAIMEIESTRRSIEQGVTDSAEEVQEGFTEEAGVKDES